MNKLHLILSMILFSAVVLNSCETESCPPNAMAYAVFSMVNQNGKPITPTVPTSVIGQVVADITVRDTLENGDIIETMVKDSVINDTIINKDSKLSMFKVPLSYYDKTSFIIDYNGKQKDKIEITHRNIPYVMDIECGTMMFHEVTDATHSNGIDSIVIVNPNIDNYEKENFKIYFTVTDSQ